MINYSKYRSEILEIIKDNDVLDKNTYIINEEGKINI